MWFVFALFTIFAWGGSDLFSKMGSKREDGTSHWKMVAAVGLVMGLHAVVQLVLGAEYSPGSFVTYLPVSLLYIFAMVLGYAGLRYLQLSVSSPICNASGAIAMLLTLVILKETMSAVQGVAMVFVCGGVFTLAVMEKRSADRDLLQAPDKKYTKSAVAVLLPVLYALIDGGTSF